MVYNNKCQSTSTAKTPDPDTDTTWNDWLPMCGDDLSHGFISFTLVFNFLQQKITIISNPDRECNAMDTCCSVYRGLNWTQSVCKCREYGGDIATPANAYEDEKLAEFIESIWANRFNFSNTDWCRGATGTPDCNFLQEGLVPANWGDMIIWIGYRNRNVGQGRDR